MTRVIGIDLRHQQVYVGPKAVDLRLPEKDLQRQVFLAFEELDDRDRYIAALEIIVDHFVSKALPGCLSFLMPQNFNLERIGEQLLETT